MIKNIAEMIDEIKTNYRDFLEYIPRLQELYKTHPNILIGLSIDGGDCEQDGTVIPITKDGEFDNKNKRDIREGEPTPTEPYIFVPNNIQKNRMM